MQRNLFWSGVVFMVASTVLAGEIRLPCVKDNWISAYGAPGVGGNPAETDFSMGKTKHIKLKTIQEGGIFDFDASALKGKKIEKATLYLHEEAPTKLRWMGASTVASDWVEGNEAGDYKLDAAGCGATFNEASYSKLPWAYPGSSLADVTMTGGNTLDWHGEVKRMPGGWLALEIDPKLVSSLMLRDCYGLFVQDDGLGVGQNSFVQSRESGPQTAPYISVVLGASDNEPPGNIADLNIMPAIEQASLTGGAVTISFTVPKDAFCYFITVNGKALERRRTPRPGQSGVVQTISIDEIAPGPANVAITVCDEAGNGAGPFAVTGQTSPALAATEALPEINKAALFDGKPAQAGVPPVRGGQLRVWALGEVDETSPADGKLLHAADQVSYMKQNHVWDGSSGRIRVAGIRNETVAFQLVVEAVTGRADGVQVMITDLAGQDGSIPATSVSIDREWYIKTAQDWQPEVAVPLTPGEAFNIPAPDNKVDGQRVQALYFNILIPKTAAPGLYKGEVRVAARGVDGFALPLEVKVYGATMPDELCFLPELNAYGEPGGAGSEYWYACHRLAHKHRSVLNVVAYGQSGNVHEYIPSVAGSGAGMKVADWSKFDNIMGPLLDGSAFDDKTPLPVLYLPFHENWPVSVDTLNYSGRKHGKGVRDEFFQTAPALDKLFPADYKAAFSAVAGDFARHLAEKGWTKTEYQCYLNNKPNYREDGNGTAWWTLDEPYNYTDWEALKLYGQMFYKGIEGLANTPGKPTMFFRGDISRPAFQRNIMRGLMGCMYAGGAFFDRWIACSVMARDYPMSVRAYGSCNPVERPSLESQAWCIKSFIYGGDGVLPWQTIAGPGSLRSADTEAIIIDGQKDFPSVKGPVASLRLKALRRGEQDVEYLNLLMKTKGYTREQVRDLVLRKLNLKTEFKQKFSDDAAAVSFGSLSEADIASICEAIAQVIGTGQAAAPRPKAVASTGVQARTPAAQNVVQPDASGAAAFIKKAVLDEIAAGQQLKVTVEFGGMPMPGKITAATEEGLTAIVGGNEMPVAWTDMRPVRLYELATRVVEDTAEAHLKLAHYCLGNGLTAEGLKELEAAEAKGAPKEQIEGLRAFANAGTR